MLEEVLLAFFRASVMSFFPASSIPVVLLFPEKGGMKKNTFSCKKLKLV